MFRRFFAADLAGPAAAGPADPAGRSRPRCRVFTVVALACHAGRASCSPRCAGAEPGLGRACRRGRAGRPARWPAARTPPPACCARPACRSCCSCWRWASSSQAVVAQRPGQRRSGSRPGRLRPAGPAGASPGWPPPWPTWSTTCPRCSCCCPLAAPRRARAVLAVLIGVNIGPNLSYAGSLATLLWRRLLRRPRPPTGPGRVHPAGAAHRARRAGAGHAGAVGRTTGLTRVRPR